jgi:hypothetical protein
MGMCHSNKVVPVTYIDEELKTAREIIHAKDIEINNLMIQNRVLKQQLPVQHNAFHSRLLRTHHSADCAKSVKRQLFHTITEKVDDPTYIDN